MQAHCIHMNPWIWIVDLATRRLLGYPYYTFLVIVDGRYVLLIAMSLLLATAEHHLMIRSWWFLQVLLPTLFSTVMWCCKMLRPWLYPWHPHVYQVAYVPRSTIISLCQVQYHEGIVRCNISKWRFSSNSTSSLIIAFDTSVYLEWQIQSTCSTLPIWRMVYSAIVLILIRCSGSRKLYSSSSEWCEV